MGALHFLVLGLALSLPAYADPNCEASFLKAEDCFRQPEACRQVLKVFVDKRPQKNFQKFKDHIHEEARLNGDEQELRALFKLMPQTLEEKRFRYRAFVGMLKMLSERPDADGYYQDWASGWPQEIGLFHQQKPHLREAYHATTQSRYESMQRTPIQMSVVFDNIGFGFSSAITKHHAYEHVQQKLHDLRGVAEAEGGVIVTEVLIDQSATVVEIDRHYADLLADAILDSRRLLTPLLKVFPELRRFRHPDNGALIWDNQVLSYLLGADVILLRIPYRAWGLVTEHAVLNPFVINGVRQISYP